jgi:cell fate regulator YaaT (PSP1 superfamily)
MDWALFTNDDADADPLPLSSLLPSSLRDLGDPLPQAPASARGDSRISSGSVYEVEFHPNRSGTFHAAQGTRFSVGQFVATEADRGFDVGVVSRVIDHPFGRDVRDPKMILRAATQREVEELPRKGEKEERALQLCRAKVVEARLPMNITTAEFQFDGKKLTFYYTADNYIDFRGLVRTLFKTFGTDRKSVV